MKKSTNLPYWKRPGLWVQLIIILGSLSLIPKLTELSASREALSSIPVNWVIVATSAFILSFVCASGVYIALSEKPLIFKNTFIVQLATAFTNRLLPSGLGGLGTNMIYLKKVGNSKPASMSYVAANNIIGFVAFCLVVMSSGALDPSFLKDMFGDVSKVVWITIVALIICIILLSVLLPKFRKWIKINTLNVLVTFIKIAQHPSRLFGALLSSLGITFCFLLCLQISLRGAGVSLQLAPLVTVFAASAVATSASPTPGGLGASELAMVIALKQLGVDDVLALRGILIYRLSSFWLPILPGILSFRYITKKKLI